MEQEAKQRVENLEITVGVQGIGYGNYNEKLECAENRLMPARHHVHDVSFAGTMPLTLLVMPARHPLDLRQEWVTPP